MVTHLFGSPCIITFCSCKHGGEKVHNLSNNQQTSAVQQQELFI